MRYVHWVIRLAVFVVILMFALKNTGLVDVRFFADHVVTNVPLIVVMLVLFILGALLGWLITLPSVMKHRREANRLRRDKTELQGKVDHLTKTGKNTTATGVSPLATPQ